MRIMMLLLLTMVGAGQAWADEPQPQQFGHITYNGTANGGALTFYRSSKVYDDDYKLTLTNGQSAALTSDDLDPIHEDPENQASAIIGYRFFIMATPAVGRRLPAPAADGTVSFIHAEVVTPVQQAPLRRNAPDPTIGLGQKLDVKFERYYCGEGGSSDPATDYYGLYYVVMPADVNLSVSITATFPGVATNTETISYVDADGLTKSKAAGEVYVLDGTEPRLGYGSYNNRTEHETWYVLPKDLTYTNGLELYGKVHLILADGKTMIYDGTESFIYTWGTLDIYGQGGTTEGAINVKTTEEQCIIVTNGLTINGGNVSAESTNTSSTTHYGIRVGRILTINGGSVNGKSNYTGIGGCDIYINGGIVNATGTFAGIHTASGTILTITGGHVCGVGGKFGMRGMKGVIITGGQIEATGGTGDDEFGILSDHGDITLGWTNATDYIKANSYHCGTEGKAVKTADGQRLVALNMADANDISASTIVSGTVGDVTTLANKTLKPLDGNYVSINSVDFTFSGTTSTTSPFTITTGEGENTTTTHYYIYKSNDPVTLSYTGSGFVQVTGATLAAVENQPLQRTFTMAASDVALTATAVTAPTITDVTYDGTAHAPEIQQGAPENYVIAYKLGENAVTEARNVGTYTCTMTGLGQYIGTATVSFDITKRSTSLAVEIVDPVTTIDGHPLIIAGDDAHVKVTLVPVAGEGETNLPKINGIVTIFVGSKDYTVAIVNGEGHYYVNNLTQGSYDITAEFNGDANHAVSTSAATMLEVCKILTETTSSVDKTPVDGGDMPMMNVGEAVKFTAELKEVGLQRPVIDSETGKKKEYRYPKADVKPLSIDAAITVILDGSASTVGVTNGTGTITFKKLLVHQDLPPHIDAEDIWRELRDHYVFVAIYAGNDRYNWSESGYVRLKVNRIPITINASVTSPVIAK